MSAILEVNGLCKRYPTGFTLDDVSFAIPGGSIMGFVGENGSGKTTTFGCILNTLIKDSGSVKIFGEEMTDDATFLRDDIGVVYDTSPYIDLMTPKKIASAMRHIFTRWDDTHFNEYLDRLKLPAKQMLRHYSRGMTMKLGMAIALAHRPRLLLLDEATSGLDPIVRDDILDVLLEFVTDENRAVLMSSHITSDLEKVADYITFIHEGRVIFSAPKDKLKYEYGIMRCKAAQFAEIDPADALAVRKHDYQTDVLVADITGIRLKYPDVVIDTASIEEIMLMMVKGEAQ